MTDEELKDLVASLAIAQAKTDEELQKFVANLTIGQAKTDKQLQETDKQLKETDKQLKETDKQLKEAMKQTDKQLKELGKQIGGLGNKFGSLTEGMAFPSMQRLLEERFEMDTILPNAKKRLGDDIFEIDVLAYNNGQKNEVYIVEVKSRLDRNGLAQILKLMEKFPQIFPEHADKKLYGIVAAIDVMKDMKEQVLESGLYFARIRDDQFTLQTPKHFKPRCFNPI